MPIGKALALAAALLLMGPAQAAATYDRVYVFGDSLVDSGNAQTGAPFFGIPDPAPASQGYFEGRLSNGYNYADDISQKLGLGPAEAYYQGGTNYAVGGATTATIPPNVIPDPTAALIPSFAEQLAIYQKSLTGGSAPYPPTTRPAIDANSLVIVNFGGNDVRDFLRYGTPSPTASVLALQSGLQTLITDGARNIVVVGLPDIGKIPSVVALGPVAEVGGTALSLNLNTAYKGVADLADASLGGNGSIDFFNLFAFQDTAEANPAAFGLNPALLKTSCVADSAQANGCQGYLFFDGIHPTQQVHSLIADAIATQLGIAAVPETSTWLMLVIGFGAIGSATRRQRRERATV